MAYTDDPKKQIEEAKTNLKRQILLIFAYAICSCGFIVLHYLDPKEPRGRFDWIVIAVFGCITLLNIFASVRSYRQIKQMEQGEGGF